MEFVQNLEINKGGPVFKQIPCIEGKGAPTTATEGAVGLFYMDTDSDNGDLFKCVAKNDGVYSWKPVDKEAVRYTKQNLTPEQKAQARENIGAESVAVKTKNTPVVLNGNNIKSVTLLGEAETEYKYSALSETIRSHENATITLKNYTEQPYLYGKRYVKNEGAPTSWSDNYIQLKFDNLCVGQEYTFCMDCRKTGNMFSTIYVVVYDSGWGTLNGTGEAQWHYDFLQDRIYVANFTIPEGKQPYVNVRLYARGESTDVIFDNVYINRSGSNGAYHTERFEEYGTFTGNKTFETLVNGVEFNTIPECIASIAIDTMGENNPVPVSKFHGKTMVCFGDSITGNYSAPTDYPSIIAEMTGMTVYNCGFGGCRMGNHPTPGFDAFSMYKLADAITTGDFSYQYEIAAGDNFDIKNTAEHLNNLKTMDWANVDYISIAYGTNDIQGGNAVDNADNPLDTNTYLGAFRYSIEKIMTAFPHIKVLVLTPMYRFYPETGEDSDSTLYNGDKKFTEWGDGLMEAAEELKIPCVDMYRTLGINKYNRALYFPATDGTHPNSIGRKAIGEKIAARMSAEF